MEEGRVKLSFSCIGHNEEKHISELLPKLLEFGDEVVYVDCDSKDNSYKVAEELGCKVFHRPNNTNLNVNKSFGFEQTTNEWIFYVDPDERFTDELLDEIKEKINTNPKENGFKLSRKNFFFGRWLRYGGQYPDNQLRLFRKSKSKFANKHVHEKLQVEGAVGKLKNDLIHYPFLTVAQFLQKFSFYVGFEAEYLYKQNTALNFKNFFYYLFFKPSSRFIKYYFFKGGFRDGLPGFFVNVFNSVGWIARFVRLWEMKKNEREG